MKKEIALASLSIFGATLLSIGLLRIMVPQLFGASSDMQFVQSSETVPPFFDLVFSEGLSSSDKFLYKDPITSVRGIPFFPETPGIGPHDVLGFRNRRVPMVADLICIGDSMTYGNNAILSESWPQALTQSLSNSSVVEYTLATGGWGAVEYLDLFSKALVFKPKVVIVAIYSGNDAIESFRDAYRLDTFKKLRPDPTLSIKDLPSIPFPPPADEFWKVQFKDGSSTILTPKHRLLSNSLKSKVVAAGYGVILNAVKKISELAKANQIKLVVSIIPTKELVFSERLKSEGIPLREDYRELIDAEQVRIDWLTKELAQISELTLITLAPALQKEALQNSLIYPPDSNGHPLADGYALIAQALKPAVDSALPQLSKGLLKSVTADNQVRYFLMRHDTLLLFATSEIAQKNGWDLKNGLEIPYRDLQSYALKGVIRSVEPVQFGPGA